MSDADSRSQTTVGEEASGGLHHAPAGDLQDAPAHDLQDAPAHDLQDAPAGDLRNAEIAEALEELGDLYELDGAVSHRVLAYRAAAKSVRETSVSVASLARSGRAGELPGIGKTIEGKILALLDTGTIPAAARLRQLYPSGLVEIMHLQGIGAKRARALYDELGIDSPPALRRAAEAQRLRTLKGFGAKSEQRVLDALREAELRPSRRRALLPVALQSAEVIVAGLKASGPPDARIEIAGSIRRGVESVKDIDLVASTSSPEQLAQALAKLPEIESVGSSSTVGAKGMTHSGLGVDLRISPPGRLGNLIQHFTGSAAHNAALREMAVKEGLHVSEHRIENERTGATIVCETEEEVYLTLGLDWIPPELREDRGELEAARRRPGGDRLPELIVETDILGDLHCHTTASDGVASIEEMAQAAIELGHRYLAITDHSASHGFGNDVSPEKLSAQIEQIAEIDARLPDLTLLAGSEVNILPDGSLDYEDELLSRLDWVVASVHTSFAMPEEQMTKRVLTAIEHPCVDAIGHLTGRLIERRQPYAVDVDAVIAAAARTGTMLEINASPERRDLSEVHARAAAKAGCMLVICSDAHRPGTLSNMRWGVATARRAWLSRADIANTLSWEEISRLRKRMRRRGACRY